MWHFDLLSGALWEFVSHMSPPGREAPNLRTILSKQLVDEASQWRSSISREKFHC